MESGTDIGIVSMRENNLEPVPVVDNKCFPDSRVTEQFKSGIEF